jgi:transcription elongation factor SPT5
VGVVVKVEHSSFKVLSTSGTLRTVPLAEMGRKRSSRGAVALDADSNLISEGDVLQLTDAADGRQGVVKHLFKSFLFLHSREQPEHAGIFVARARQTRLVDGKGGGGGGKAAAYQGQSYGVATGEGGALPYGGGAAGGAGGRGWGQDGGRFGGGGRGFGGGRGGRADELQNAHVRIQAGPYKGMYGTVKSATDGVARVELSAKSKVVTLGKDKLLIVQRAGEAADGARQMGGGGGMGGLGGGLGGGFGMGGGGGLGLPTPLRDDGFRTPMRDGGLYPSTPMRDAMPMTPMRDGELGGGEGARASDPWDPTKTPAHDPWANVGARTPSHSAAWGMGGASESAGGGGGGGVHHDEYAGLGLAPHWPPRAG